MKILLNKKRSKTSINVNNSLITRLKSNKRVLPLSTLHTTINEIDLYNQERQNCNTIRLNCVINPICSNVLFNNITEIVKNEGSPSEVKLLNYKTEKGFISNSDFEGKLYCKPMEGYKYSGASEAIRDTQISNKRCGFEYHCGVDIFNNHLLRNKTFKTVCYDISGISNSFNTINDYMRDESGKFISGYGYKEKYLPKQHLYLKEEIDTFEDTIDNQLKEKNGWFGFTNVGQFQVRDDNGEMMDIGKVINNQRSCDFIQMYPTSDLWSFTPKYNPYLNRLEKNWNYCLTYPYSSTTYNITFIRENTNSLKIMYLNDNYEMPNGIMGIKIYSVSKHGLKKGDFINLYKGDEVAIPKAQVVKIDNDYIFYINKNSVDLCNLWYELTKANTDTDTTDNFKIYKTLPYEEIKNGEDVTLVVNYNGIKYTLTLSNDKVSVSDKNNNPFEKNYYYLSSHLDKFNKTITMRLTYTISNDREEVYNGYGDDMKTYFLIDHKLVNLDDDAQDFSFKKIVNNQEVKYYVRIFKKLGEYENHISNLAFAKNIYGDNLSEIVFTDDIEISDELHDNLGRPLTSLYLTILKNNKGYKEWYGKNGKEIEIRGYNDKNNEDYHIEYSHCFGMLNCAFRLSKESLPNVSHNNVMVINNVDSSFHFQGLDCEDIQNENLETRKKITELLNDEIQYTSYEQDGTTYSGDNYFYGDLCYYTESLAEETKIQDIEFRFNTAQREVGVLDKSYNYFNKLKYDEIEADDYDESMFTSKQYEVLNGNQRREGYCYFPHYEIPIKTLENKINYINAIDHKIKKIDSRIDVIGKEKKYSFIFTTLAKHDLNKQSSLHLKYTKYNEVTKQAIVTYYNVIIEKIINFYSFKAYLTSTDGQPIKTIDTTNILGYKLFQRPLGIPDYSTYTNDGSCRFFWRNVIQNGYDNNSDIEQYPFMNGCLYVNKHIDLFVKRQDPNEYTRLQTGQFPIDMTPNIIKKDKQDNYIQEKDITC